MCIICAVVSGSSDFFLIRTFTILIYSDEEEALHLIYVLEAIFLHGSLSPKVSMC